MTILSLEFSAAIRSVAVWIAGTDAIAQIIVTDRDHGPSRIHPLTLIAEALHRSSLKASNVDLIAVGLGPGSYTGIRSAIAVAQGWMLGTSIKAAGISSVHCIAEQALSGGMLGGFHVVVDAQRDEFYVADYESDGGTVRVRKELRILTRIETSRLASPLVGPDLTASGLIGTAISPCAGFVARIAKKQGRSSEASELIPIYLRETAFIKAPPARILPT